MFLKTRSLIAGSLCFIFFLSCQQSGEQQNAYRQENGALDSTFIDTSAAVTNEPLTDPVKSPEQVLYDEGWSDSPSGNGTMPECYNYRPAYGENENSLTVNVGNGTAVIIKVVSLMSGDCVRYVFINSSSSYVIKNLPEDQYYLKIAYGRDWVSKAVNNVCKGKFMHQPTYKKGESVLDFSRGTLETYQIRQYELSLDVVAGNSQDSFNSNAISEEEFNL